MRRVRVVVSGRVQGVWYRDSCRAEAEAAGVAGWVANRGDGTVEAVLEGEPDAVDRVLAWMHDGPRRARVDAVGVEEEEPEGLPRFAVR